MNVKELIDRLQELPLDAEIYVDILGSHFLATPVCVSTSSDGKAFIVVDNDTERQARVEHTDRCVDSIQQAMCVLKNVVTEMQWKAGFF